MTKASPLISFTLVLVLVLALGGCRVQPRAQAAGPKPTPTPTTRFVIPLRSITPGPTLPPPATPTIGMGLVRVEVSDNLFNPNVVTVTVGSTLSWKYQGISSHNITAADHSWSGSLIGTRDPWEYKFNREGVYDYYCTIHAAGMRGQVIVVR